MMPESCQLFYLVFALPVTVEAMRYCLGRILLSVVCKLRVGPGVVCAC